MRRSNLCLGLVLASACSGQSVRYVEVPGDAGVTVEQCSSDTQCGPDATCGEDGFCVRVEERVVEHGEVCDGRDNNEDGYADEGLLAFGPMEELHRFGCAVAAIVSDVIATEAGHAFLLQYTNGANGPSGRCNYEMGGGWKIVSVDEASGVTVSDTFLRFDFGSGLGSEVRDLIWTGGEFAAIFEGIDPERVSRHLVTFDKHGVVRMQQKVASPIFDGRGMARLLWSGSTFVVASARGDIVMDMPQVIVSLMEIRYDGAVFADSPLVQRPADELARHFSIAKGSDGAYRLAFYAPSRYEPSMVELSVLNILQPWQPGDYTGVIVHGSLLVAGDLMPLAGGGYLIPARVSNSRATFAATLDATGAVVEEFTSRPAAVMLVQGDTAIGVDGQTAYRFTLDGSRVLDGRRIPDQSMDGRFWAAGTAKFDYYFVDQNPVFDSGTQPILKRSRFGCSD